MKMFDVYRTPLGDDQEYMKYVSHGNLGIF